MYQLDGKTAFLYGALTDVYVEQFKFSQEEEDIKKKDKVYKLGKAL